MAFMLGSFTNGMFNAASDVVGIYDTMTKAENRREQTRELKDRNDTAEDMASKSSAANKEAQSQAVPTTSDVTPSNAGTDQNNSTGGAGPGKLTGDPKKDFNALPALKALGGIKASLPENARPQADPNSAPVPKPTPTPAAPAPAQAAPVNPAQPLGTNPVAPTANPQLTQNQPGQPPPRYLAQTGPSQALPGVTAGSPSAPVSQQPGGTVGGVPNPAQGLPVQNPQSMVASRAGSLNYGSG